MPSGKEKEKEEEEEEEEEKEEEEEEKKKKKKRKRKKKKNLTPRATFFSQNTTRSSANVHCLLKFIRHCFHIPGRPASFIRRKYLSKRQG